MKEQTPACMSESTVLCSERFLRKIFTFFLVPKSLWTLPLPIMAKQGKASRFLKADAVPVPPVFFFFFAPANGSLRALVSNGMSVDYEADKGTTLRESVQLTPVGQMMKQLSIESWRNTRSCSASEVMFVKDPPIERPTCSGHSNRIAEKVKQCLSGCIPVDEKYGA